MVPQLRNKSLFGFNGLFRQFLGLAAPPRSKPAPRNHLHFVADHHRRLRRLVPDNRGADVLEIVFEFHPRA